MMHWIILVYAVISVLTFLMYGLDKRRAVKGAWRIRESTLHLLELLGGFPGALLGQGVFRHKMQKWSFRIVTWVIALAHGAIWVWWWMRKGG